VTGDCPRRFGGLANPPALRSHPLLRKGAFQEFRDTSNIYFPNGLSWGGMENRPKTFRRGTTKSPCMAKPHTNQITLLYAATKKYILTIQVKQCIIAYAGTKEISMRTVVCFICHTYACLRALLRSIGCPQFVIPRCLLV